MSAPTRDGITESTSAAIVPTPTARKSSVHTQKKTIDKAKVLISKEQVGRSPWQRELKLTQ
jgi:hypothetical protein